MYYPFCAFPSGFTRIQRIVTITRRVKLNNSFRLFQIFVSAIVSRVCERVFKKDWRRIKREKKNDFNLFNVRRQKCTNTVSDGWSRHQCGATRSTAPPSTAAATSTSKKATKSSGRQRQTRGAKHQKSDNISGDQAKLLCRSQTSLRRSAIIQSTHSTRHQRYD